MTSHDASPIIAPLRVCCTATVDLLRARLPLRLRRGDANSDGTSSAGGPVPG